MNLKLLCAACAVSILFAVSAAAAESPRWLLIDSSPESDFLYDTLGTKNLGDGIVAVTVKVSYSPEGKQETLNLLKNDKRYTDLAYTLYSYDLNCATRMERLHRVVHIDSKGAQVTEFNLAGKTEWEETPPGTRMDLVIDQACSPGRESPAVPEPSAPAAK